MTDRRGTLLIMAGGTGGHIMPGLAVAKEMQARGWDVQWMGNPVRMEGRLVPAHGIPLKALEFAGLRGKGAKALIKLPLALSTACAQASRILREVRPDVVLGMGGYVSVPGGLVSRFKKIPLILHEQNAVAGSANKLLARKAAAVFTGFPDVLPGGVFVGNPVRQEFLQLLHPQERYADHQGPLRILVVGGSLGAQVLNETIPEALALMPEDARPQVTHQAGELHIEFLREHYKRCNVQAECVAFIDDMAAEMARADVIICRAGAMTVAEVAAAGIAAIFVPLPTAIDDHQRHNAQWLTGQNAAITILQKDLTPAALSSRLLALNREELAGLAQKAKSIAKDNATQTIADACEKYSKDNNEA